MTLPSLIAVTKWGTRTRINLSKPSLETSFNGQASQNVLKRSSEVTESYSHLLSLPTRINTAYFCPKWNKYFLILYSLLRKVVALASLKLYYLPVRNDERKLDSKTAKLLLIKGILIPFNKIVYTRYITVRNDEEKTNLVDPIITARSFLNTLR